MDDTTAARSGGGGGAKAMLAWVAILGLAALVVWLAADRNARQWHLVHRGEEFKRLYRPSLAAAPLKAVAIEDLPGLGDFPQQVRYQQSSVDPVLRDVHPRSPSRSRCAESSPPVPAQHTGCAAGVEDSRPSVPCESSNCSPNSRGHTLR